MCLRQNMNSNSNRHNPHDQSRTYQSRWKVSEIGELTESKVIAVELRKLAVPNLNINKINKSEKKLKKRFNRVVGKLANNIEKNYPVVLSSSKRLTELHEMRKDCKKLRYLLELLPIGTNSKGEGKDKVSQLIEELEKVQDMLGAIHDHDATIAYIKKYLENHHKDRSLTDNCQIFVR